MNTLGVLILFVAVASVYGQAGVFKDCGSQVGKINKLQIFPCLAEPCQLKKGKSYTINVTFTITESTDQAFANVYGEIGGTSVPFPLDLHDACKGGKSGLTCPLKKNTEYVYTATLPISSFYPSLKVTAKWVLSDFDQSGGKTGNKIFCLLTPLAIVS